MTDPQAAADIAAAVQSIAGDLEADDQGAYLAALQAIDGAAPLAQVALLVWYSSLVTSPALVAALVITAQLGARHLAEDVIAAAFRTQLDKIDRPADPQTP